MHCNTRRNTATQSLRGVFEFGIIDERICNTLQRTATRCNIHCNTRRNTATQSLRGVLEFGIINERIYNILQRTATRCNAHCNTHCNTHRNTVIMWHILFGIINEHTSNPL